MPKPLRLAAVLNHGDSLRQWERAGLLQVQSTLLREFQDRGMEITIVSFGGREELAFSERLGGMRILCNWMGLPDATYARRLHQIHARHLLSCQLVQTTDATGIIAAMRIAWSWQIPLVYRFGFVLSWTRRRTMPSDTATIKHLESSERRGLALATHVLAPTRNIADGMIEMVPAVAAKLTVMPNFVDAERFQPLPLEKRFDLVYVGRTSKVKNLWALLEAVEKLNVTIAMIGGPLPREVGTEFDESQRLKDRFGDLDGRIHWLGRIEQDQLPAHINQARAFILCSLSEGNARSLLEAMACGMPCIGADVPEIKYMLKHEVNGFLCGTDADSIAAAIETVLAKPDLMRKMGENARRFARENHSLSNLAQREFDLLGDIARRNPLESAPKRLANYFLRRR